MSSEDSIKAFGANPLPMAYGELYTALEQHVVDGAEAASRTVYKDWADRIGGMDLIEKIIQFDYK